MAYKSTLIVDTYVVGRYFMKEYTVIKPDGSRKKNYIITDSKIPASELEIDSQEELEDLLDIINEVR